MKFRSLTLAAAALAASFSAAEAQNYSLAPTFGVISLQTGYLPDPNWVSVLAGGSIYVTYPDVVSGGTCAGYVADAPDFRVHFEAGQEYPLTFYAESHADLVLLINAPDGSWHCNDDHTGLDPAVSFEAPQSGQYDIWVGTYAPIQNSDYPHSVLSMTELAPFASSFARSFFGEDDRVVVDASSGPWSMIGLVEFDDGSCTGTLVGPSTVLTAAHCLSENGQVTSRAIEFIAGASNGSFTARSTITGYHLPQSWMRGEADGTDFAFLFLADPIGDRIGWMDVGPLTAEESRAILAGQGAAVMQGGYSFDQADVITANLNCPVLELRPNNTVNHQCDTLQGDSGSPLFIETDTGYRIIGVESHTLPQPSLEYDLNIAMYAEWIAREFAAVQSGAATSGAPQLPSK